VSIFLIETLHFGRKVAGFTRPGKNSKMPVTMERQNTSRVVPVRSAESMRIIPFNTKIS